jgi:hypothetical protein
MPAARKEPEQPKEITSTMLGSESPDVTSHPLAVVGQYPEDYVNNPDNWKRAYDYAASRGNTTKACVNWADGHEADAEYASKA